MIGKPVIRGTRTLSYSRSANTSSGTIQLATFSDGITPDRFCRAIAATDDVAGETEMDLTSIEGSERIGPRRFRRLALTAALSAVLGAIGAAQPRGQVPTLIRDTVTRDYADAILPFDEEIAQVWGEAAGTTCGESLDKQIAATALMYNLTVVTRNVPHYEPTGVAVLNPFT